LIFTYRGQKSTGGRQDDNNNPDPKGFYYEDIMISNKVNGAWTEPVGIGSNINGIGHDACIALSTDGQKLFVYKYSQKDGGDIYISKLEGSKWSVPEKLQGEVNTQYYESSASLSADERTLYFSSSRPGGYGGTDIYTAKIKADGTWGRIENMGPDINTPYDDDDPFIHSSGALFIFSSQGHNSMGGADIFVSVKNGDKWTKAENVGVPVNTPDNDRFYVLSADGKRGYYSSFKTSGLGDADIYTVEPGLPGKSAAMVMLSGTVYVDDKPVGANIIVGYVDNDDVQGDYTANSTTGKYLTTLPAGKNYKLIYVVEGFDDQIQTIDATNTTSFEEKKLDIKLYTADKNKSGIVEQPVDKPVEQPVTTTESPADDAVKARTSAPTLTKPIAEYTYEEIIEQFGEMKPEGVTFSVQVGAYREPENFRGANIKSLGQIKKENGSDGITRFSQGPFPTLKAAESHRKKVIGKGTYDAFVTAFYNGQRMTLKEIFAKMAGQ
jgi:hypothetical protein